MSDTSVEPKEQISEYFQIWLDFKRQNSDNIYLSGHSEIETTGGSMSRSCIRGTESFSSGRSGGLVLHLSDTHIFKNEE